MRIEEIMNTNRNSNYAKCRCVGPSRFFGAIFTCVSRLFDNTNFLCNLIISVILLTFITYLSWNGRCSKSYAEDDIRTGKDTLVLYTFSATDPEYLANLRFFVKYGMDAMDGCDYYIIVQDLGERDVEDLPRLPSHAHYIHHENVCYDWGTFGWALRTLGIRHNMYTYFIFMNSSVRGPFMTSFWPAKSHWSKIFQAKLTSEVKLVGSTISCEPVHANGNPHGALRNNAHVQSYLMATDQIGLQILLEDGHIFECHQSIADAVYNAELGASLAIFNAGYTIDSLMLRYQGVNWNDPMNWDCNGRLNPYAEFAYDGISLNPMEVVFIKVKAFQKDAEWTSTSMAIRYDRWMHSLGRPGAVNFNSYKNSPMRFRMARILQMQMRGQNCFDFAYYRHFSPDYPVTHTNDELWEDFLISEQFAGRQFRFLCQSPFQSDEDVIKMVHWQAQKLGSHVLQ